MTFSSSFEWIGNLFGALIVVPGMLGNGLIGMAALFAAMGKRFFGKFVPTFFVLWL